MTIFNTFTLLVHQIPLKKPRLAPNAIPTIFPSSNVVETQVEITYEHVTPKEELIESSFPDEPGDDIGYTNGNILIV